MDNEPTSQNEQLFNNTNNNSAEIERSGFTKFWNDLIDFIKPILWLFLITFFGGGILAAIAEIFLETPAFFHGHVGFLEIGKFFVYLLKDIGIGMVVAAVSVFGFEYIRKIRKEKEKEIELDQHCQTLASTVATLGHLSELKGHTEKFNEKSSELISSVAENRFEQSLNGIFYRNEAEQKFSASLQKLIKEAVELKNFDTLESQEYLKFIASLTENLIIKNAEGLLQIEKSRNSYVSTVTWNYAVLETRKVAAMMLSHQLNALKAKDLYCSVSDIGYWQAQAFKLFFDEIKKACLDGIKVQRIFNVTSWANKSNQIADNDFRNAKKIIQSHLDLADKEKNYEVRFFCRKHIQQAIDDNESLDENSLAGSRFGVFIYMNPKGEPSGDAVCFKALDPNLGNMSLTRSNTKRYIERFDTMWKVTEEAPNPFKNETFNSQDFS